MTRRHLIVAGKFALSIPLAWAIGSMGFGVLAEGTWIFAAILAFLPETVFNFIAAGAYAACLITAWLCILFGWVFERAIPARTRNL